MANPAKVARDNAQAIWPGASVVGRGRNGIMHRHPSDMLRFMLDADIGPIHYNGDQEIDTAWQPGIAPWDFEMVKAGYNAFALADFSSGQIVKYVDPVSGEDITFQPQQLQYTNDLDQIQAIANPQPVNGIVQAGDDKILWTGAYGPGFDLRWECQTARLDKRLIVDQASRFPAPEPFIIAGGEPVLRFQFIFQKSNGLDIFIDGAEWNEAPNNPTDTADYVEFRSKATGAVLWAFNLPRSFQKDGKELIGTFRLRKTGPNLFVEHRIPVDWLQAATYPIEIDVTVDEQVAASADDGYWVGDGDDYVDTTSAYVLIGDFAAEVATDAGYRFASVTIANGVTIDVAYLTFTPQATDSGTMNTIWYGSDYETPANFTTTTPNNHTHTTASVTENPPANWTDNTPVNSSSLVGIVQELEDSYDYSGGGVMAFLWTWDEVGSNERLADSYDHSSSTAAKLHIEYTAAAGDPEGLLVRGKLVGGGLLAGRLTG